MSATARDLEDAPKVQSIRAQKAEQKASRNLSSRGSPEWIPSSWTISSMPGTPFILAFLRGQDGEGLKALGWRGVTLVSRACGLSRKAIRKGIREIESGETLAGRIRRAGGGRKSITETDPKFRNVAADTANMLEYQGTGWTDPASNAIYLQAAVSTDKHPLCPVRDMEVDRKTTLRSVYKGKTYLFCSEEHKAQFDAAPEKWL